MRCLCEREMTSFMKIGYWFKGISYRRKMRTYNEMEQKKNTKTFTALHLHTFDILDKNNDDWSPSDPSLLHSLTLYRMSFHPDSIQSI